MRGQRIGLLGGSFNPAHGGHRHISLLALQRLGLDHIWWLVSPQNPLKSRAGMAPFAERIAQAKTVANHPRIRVSGIEAELGTVFTVQTLRRLRRRFPAHRFVWLMGADNLKSMHRWREWRRIFRTVPIGVFDRPGSSFAAQGSRAASAFRHRRYPAAQGKALAARRTPAWSFLWAAFDDRSATALRQQALTG